MQEFKRSRGLNERATMLRTFARRELIGNTEQAYEATQSRLLEPAYGIEEARLTAQVIIHGGAVVEQKSWKLALLTLEC